MTLRSASLTLIGAAIALAALSPTARAQGAAPSPRFRDPAHITGDPTGLKLDPAAFVAPRYPDSDREKSVTAEPVVAFVVNGAGRVERGTASFLNETLPEFRQSVCEMLPKLRFHPLVLDGVKQRVLLVQMYAFNTIWQQDSVGIARADSLVRASQERFGSQPVEAVVPELEARPHCE